MTAAPGLIQIHLPAAKLWAPLAVVLAAAAILRFGTAGYSLWFDDLASYFYASQPLSRLWSTWMVRETTPPLYYSTLAVWAKMFGWSAQVARIPSILASLVAIVVVYLGVARNYGLRAAAVAAVLLAVSAQQLVMAHQVRAYILLFVAIAASFFGLVAIVRNTPRRKLAWSAYILGAITGIYLHTTAFLWPAAATLALLACDRRLWPVVGVHWLELALADLLILTGSAWWIGIVILQQNSLEGTIGWINPPELTTMPRFLLEALFLAREPAGWELAGPLLLAGLAFLGALHGWSDLRVRFTTACFVLAPLLFVLVSYKQPIMIHRTVLWVSLFPLFLVASLFRDGARAKPLASATLGLIASLALLGLNLALALPRLQKEDWGLVVRAAASTPNTVVLVDGEAMSLGLTMACRAELGLSRCPFGIVALVVSDKTVDLWAAGYGEGRFAPSDVGDIGHARVFIFGRWGHAALDELHRRGLLADIVSDGQPLKGPLPASTLIEVLRRYDLHDGLIPIGASCPADARAAAPHCRPPT
jgi:4-amino-4-deoxy-L-arabinose transferase-like glycosyltransferase